MNDLVGHARGVIEGRRFGGFRTDTTPSKPSSDAVNSVAGKADQAAEKVTISELSERLRRHIEIGFRFQLCHPH